MPTINLPTFHTGQVNAFKHVWKNRFTRLRCGRRWGKTKFGQALAVDYATKHKKVGWFVPKYKVMTEAYREMMDTLGKGKQHASKTDGVIRTRFGGRIDFWTLENENAGRSRDYDLVIIDEGAFTKKNMMDIWEQAIKPTLLDRGGKAMVMSSPKGISDENFFYQLEDPKYGFIDFHAPTHSNPLLPKEELDKLERENSPDVFLQEYLAQFIDWSGKKFFEAEKLLVDGKAIPWPEYVDCVYAVIDTAIKTGKKNDGTGVTFFAYTKHNLTIPLVILDWDVIQIQGSLLETWLPTIYERLDFLSQICKARMGSLGAFIEDKGSGTILIQQAMRRKWRVHAINSILTAMGKDERAISVSGYVYLGRVKITVPAYDKVSIYKEKSRNHLWNQVTTFKIGDEEEDREDDLFDTFCYGISISLGNKGGI